jgi:DNA-binding CsgD family transcriptional regulator
LAIATTYAGDSGSAVDFARRARQVPGIPGSTARVSDYLLTGMLINAGDTAAAEAVCVAALASARDAGDQWHLAALLRLMADLDLRTGRAGDAVRHAREALQLILQTGSSFEMANILYTCGHLCAATGSYAEMLTLLAASDALSAARRGDFPETAPWVRGHRALLGEARQVLGPDAVRAAEDRGAAMSPATAAEYVLLLTAPAQDASQPGAGRLSASERELVTLVATGRTDAQIAAHLHVSVRTVRSRLDRIRDKTGVRRRTDLAGLALAAGLI